MLNRALSTKMIKIFVINLIAVFFMAFIPHIGIKIPKMVSPLPQRIDLWEKIKPMLEIKENKFQLRKSIIPTVSAQSDYEGVSAYGAIDFDSGEVIASKNLSKKLPMASLTKVMTAIVALDLAKPDELLEVSQKAQEQEPTKVMLKKGEKYTLEELLNSLLLSSANDSAQTIKDGMDDKYKQDVFIKAMNAKAKFLGLKNTHFTNPQGYDDPEHYSTIEDLSILTRYAIDNYPLIKDIVAKQINDLTRNSTDMRFYLQNWNGLLGIYPGVSGIKIGNTGYADHCTIVLSEREGKRILSIVLGAPGVLERDFYAAQLLDLGFSKFGIEPVNLTEAQLKEKYATWKYF